jgi:hypothetical protein
MGQRYHSNMVLMPSVTERGNREAVDADTFLVLLLPYNRVAHKKYVPSKTTSYVLFHCSVYSFNFLKNVVQRVS